MAAWVYILRCADGSYYVGCTTNLEQRIAQHHAGTTGGYTASRRPVELLWCGEAQRIHDAIEVERKLKRWSRAKKEAFIAGEWDRLQALSSRSRSASAVALRGESRERRASFETRTRGSAPQDDEEG
ncbi:MAG: GIY-YIG nuclease family protein [Caulobacter sp.]|nr:GIY-YIG nuclease family protein [Caulobacter sp.]